MSTTVNQNPSAHSKSPSSFILQLLAPLLSLTNSQKSLARRSGVQDHIDHAEPLYSEEDPQIRKRSLGANVIYPEHEEVVIDHGRTYIINVLLRKNSGRCRPVYARVIRLDRLKHIDIVQKIKEHCATLYHLQDQHPNIAVVHGFSELGDFTTLPRIVMDKYNFNICAYRKHLKDQETQDEELKKITEDLLGQAAKALSFLHSKDLIHGNIQGSNFLIDTPEGKPAVLKLSDTGLARDLTLNGENPNLSWRWRPPEDYSKDAPLEHNKYIDRYSFGMTLYEVYFGKVPFHNYHGRQAILRERPEIERPDSISDELWVIHTRCTTHKSGDYPMHRVEQDFDELVFRAATSDVLTSL